MVRPFAPGDRVKLRAGTRFRGTVLANRSGTIDVKWDDTYSSSSHPDYALAHISALEELAGAAE